MPKKGPPAGIELTEAIKERLKSCGIDLDQPLALKNICQKTGAAKSTISSTLGVGRLSELNLRRLAENLRRVGHSWRGFR